MKYAFVLATVAIFAVSPAMAGGKGYGKGGSLLGGILAPVTTGISGLNVTALNNVSVLSGNKTNVNAPIKAIVSKTGIAGGLLGGFGHGCGCN